MKRAVLLIAVVSAVACDREQRRFTEVAPASGLNTDSIQVGENTPGGAAIQAPPLRPEYIDNAWAVSEGRRLYLQFNCAGCHSLYGGGGMGPPLMDDKWIYGGEPANVHASIVEGRPNGMPAFRGKIPDSQVWQLVAYLNSLSGRARQDVANGRDDHMSSHPPDVMMPPQGEKAEEHYSPTAGQKESPKE
ncbi:MAG: c-type cytochrome [Myxococcaceae bacterium]